MTPATAPSSLSTPEQWLAYFQDRRAELDYSELGAALAAVFVAFPAAQLIPFDGVNNDHLTCHQVTRYGHRP